MKYFKKPYPVNAVQFFKLGDQPENTNILTTFDNLYRLETLEGYQDLTSGCWIVGPDPVRGKFWVVQDDIFEATYAPYEDVAQLENVL